MKSGTSCRETALLVLALTACALGAPVAARAAGARSFKSGPIQVTGDGSRAWVVNPDNDSVTFVDAATDRATELPLPGAGRIMPRGLSVSEDGSEVWVACHDADQVIVLAGRDGAAGATGTILATIDLPWGSGPYSVALSRDQRLALVACHRGASLAFVDVATRRVTSTQPVYEGPLGICFLEDGVTAWVSHPFADGFHGRMTRVDLSVPGAPRVTTALRQDGSNPQLNAVDFNNDPDPSHRVAEGGYLTFRGHFAQRPGTGAGAGKVWVHTQYNNIHQDVPTPDSLVQAVIRTLDPATRLMPNTLTDKVIVSAVHVHDFLNRNAWMGEGWNAPVSGPIDVAFAADGSTAWIAFEQSDNVLVMPANTPGWKPSPAASLTTIGAGSRPIGLCVSPVADVGWVANELSRSVSKIDLASGAVIATIPTTPVTGERLPASVLNGARLFHSSADPRITPNRKVACASCHVNGEADGRTWDLQFLPGLHGPRKVQSLLGLSLSFGPADPVTGFGQLHRSGDRDEIQDFEHSFIGVQMGGTGFIPAAQRQPPLGAGPNAGLDADLDDVAEYVLSLPPIARSPHRAAGGALTPAAVRGATFFVGTSTTKPADAGCAQCHVPETGYTDQAFHDVGAYRPTAAPGPTAHYEAELNDASRAPHQWEVNTPSLVGAFAVPPYVGVAIAEDVLFMGDVLADFGASGRTAPHGRVGGLTRRQASDLAEYVLSLDGSSTADEARTAVDRQPPRLARVRPVSLTTITAWFDESVAPSVADPAAWSVTDASGAPVRVVSVRQDATWGDRVWLTTDPLPRDCSLGTPTFTVRVLGPVTDVADSASGGSANALDPADPANTRTFVLGDTLTVTLGQSGQEDLDVLVHDASVINQFLADQGNGSLYLNTLNLNGTLVHNCGFVRFDWAPAFAAATGVANPADLLEASFTLTGYWGDVKPMEVRRVLQRWWDPGTWRDRVANPVNAALGHGGPTYNASEYGVRNWNQPNAGARTAGVEGRRRSDYFGAADAAFTPDAVVPVQTINLPQSFGSPGITDAFRFWLENPDLDCGFALQLGPAETGELKFHSGEQDFGRWSPVLTITYQLPAAGGGSVPGEVSAVPSPAPLLVTKDPGGLRLSFEDLGLGAGGVTGYGVYEGVPDPRAMPWYSHASLQCGLAGTVAGAGRREVVVSPAQGLGARYLLVTASGACGEGPSGEDSFGGAHPSALLTCP